MIIDDPRAVGPHNPVPSVPARAGGDAHFDAVLESRVPTLRTIETSPDVPGLRELIGATVGPGFRKKVDTAMGDAGEHGDLLRFLLDDLSGATLVSGYAMLHAGARPRLDNAKFLVARADVCAGWADDGVMMTMIRDHERSIATQGPDAPELTSNDPDAWHALPTLVPHAMRRLRRIDVGGIDDTGIDARSRRGVSDPVHVDVFFRDSHVDEAGRETIVHEYSVTATVDLPTRSIVTVEAGADVLPWRECPGALGSAARLAGMPLAGLRPWIRRTFTGTSTCTHLNDVLCGLTDVGALIDTLLDTTVTSEL